MTHHPSFMLLNARVPRRWVWAGILAITIGLSLSMSASAFAGKIHVFGSAFGTEGSGSGEFKEPSGVAVNEVTLAQMGDVYVVDSGNNRVQWFSSEGKEFKGAFDGTATPAKSFSSPNAIAIDNSTSPLDPSAGDVYVVDSGHDVVDKFDPEGNYLGQITTGAGGEPLGEILGVAVDPAGVVWVYKASGETGEIDSYDDALSNAFLSSIVSPFGTSPGFAVDSEDHLYVNRGLLVFAKLSSTGETISEAVNPESNAMAAAVDSSTDNVYIDENSTIGAYAPSRSLIERFGAEHVSESRGVAVDAQSGMVYASNHEAGTVTVFRSALTPTVLTGEATSLGESTATLNGTVNPEGVGVGSCRFEYGHSSEYGESVECSSAPGSGEVAVPVSANVGGLELGRYHFRLSAANANGEAHGTDHAFVISAKPTIESEALVSVGASSATISAQINPNGLPGSYRLEYGTTTAYGSFSPAATVAAAFSQVGVQVTVSGLAQSTVYHARVIASNEHGGAMGAKDITFTTSSVGEAVSVSSCPNRTFTGFNPTLPDCRAYEFVSGGGGPGEVYIPVGPRTANPGGEDIQTELAMRASASGGGVAYVAEAGETGGSGASGEGLGNQFIATRGVSGWGVANMTPSLAEPEVIPNSPIYEGYSANLSTGVLASSSAALAAAATPQGPAGCEVLYDRTGDGAFHALFTATLTPGHCGNASPPESFTPQNLLFAGANEGTAAIAAASHLLFQSPAPLVAGAQESEEGGEGSNLYESIGGVARRVSVLPGGEAGANAVFGGRPAGDNTASSSRPNFANVISADGSRIFWTDLGSGKVYERVNGASTVAVSTGPATYWGASSDGHFVFYTEGEQLWRFDTFAQTREALTGIGAGVQGVAGISEDGSYVYFVAQGVLAAGAESRNCREALLEKEEKLEKKEFGPELERVESEVGTEQRGHLPAGRGCNLYLRHGSETKLVVALAAQDDRLSRPTKSELIGAWQGELGSRTAQVADGGRELVFESTQQLTGYDNSILDEARNFEWGVEAFVYEAETGHIACASCDPSGAPSALAPQGSGTSLPISLSPTFMRRWVSADGSRVFFDTSQPLSKQDTNKVQDVYEWERAGSATCPAGSSGGGCISLLSGGDSSDLSFFVDASTDGGDVFFTHRGQLGGTGRTDAHAGLFDVRADGGFDDSSTACTGTGCQGVPPAPPNFATPPSATFNGSGNFPTVGKGNPSVRKLTRAQLLAKALKACKQKKVKSKRLACEKQVRKRYGPPVKTKAKKASRRSSNGRKQ